MEMLASNPDMLKMATEQMKNMSDEDIKAMQEGRMPGSMSAAGDGAVNSNGGNATHPQSTSTTTPQPAAAPNAPPPMAMDPMQMLSSMSPEQIKQQVLMLKSMPPDQLREMDPQFRNMSDEQILAAAAQMEMLASNPDMLKMATEQMKNMSPEDIQAIRQGGMPAGVGGADAGNMDPSKMLENMDGKQLKSMLQAVKQNPQMLKQMMGPAASNMSDEQLEKSIDAFANMDEKQIERALKVMTGLQKITQPFRNAYEKTNRVVGGNLWKILVVAGILSVVGCCVLVRGWLAAGATPASLPLEQETVIDPVPDVEFEDEF